MLLSAGFLGRLAFSPDGRRLAVSDADGLILIDVAGARVLRRLEGRKNRDPGASVSFSKDGRTVAADTDYAASVLVWNAETGKVRDRVKGVGVHFALSPDGKTLFLCDRWDASSANEGTLRVWDVEARSLRREAKLDVEDVAVSPSGGFLAGACRDGKLRVWNARTLAPVAEISTEATTLLAVAFSPDGSRLAVGGVRYDDKTFRGETAAEVSDWEAERRAWKASPERNRQIVGLRFLGPRAVSLESIIFPFTGDGVNPDFRTKAEPLRPGGPVPAAGAALSPNGRVEASLSEDGKSVRVGGRTVTLGNTAIPPQR